MQHLGITLVDPHVIKTCIDAVGIGFMYAPNFHPALKDLLPIRKALKVRTVFNILGPLLNPANAAFLLLGVYTTDLLDIYAEAIYALGTKHALVVHCQGLDELATVGPTDAREITSEHGIKKIVIDAQEYGIEKCTIEDLKGSGPASNAKTIRRIFSGGANATGPIADTIALNAGAALYVYGIVESIESGYRLALSKMKSGAVLQVVDKLSEVSSKLHLEDSLRS